MIHSKAPRLSSEFDFYGYVGNKERGTTVTNEPTNIPGTNVDDLFPGTDPFTTV